MDKTICPLCQIFHISPKSPVKVLLINLWFFSLTGLPSLWWLFLLWGSPSCCGTQASPNTRPLLWRRIKANIVFVVYTFVSSSTKIHTVAQEILQVSLLSTEMSPVNSCTGLLKILLFCALITPLQSPLIVIL